MAKNFKLKIKNTQLAAVLKKKQPETKNKNLEPEKDTKKRVRSKILKPITPDSLESKSQENKEEKEIPSTKIAKNESPMVEEKKPVTNAENVAPKEKKVIKEDKEQQPAAEPKKEKTKEVISDPKHKRSTPSSPDNSTGSNQKDKNSKNPKEISRRQAFKKVFDGRDKHGLRTTDDGTWKRSRGRRRVKKKQVDPSTYIRPKEITIRAPILCKDLANEMKIKSSEIIQKLFLQGLPITINDVIEDETIIELIGNEFSCKINIDKSESERLNITDYSIAEEISKSEEKQLKARPPVITVMGHVDHGKTSIIDALRKSNLADKEAGSITQHIGAFTCDTKSGPITILDTPGHEAFTAIRERGAAVTDIVVLVIAGDEGIKPQTIEAIEQAREANVPLIVAINKSDKPNYDPDNIYRQLADHSLLPEAWGGDIITVNCSAKTGDGLEDLVEMLALQSEILELKASSESRARGTVLESHAEKGLGTVATVIVQNGTLRINDPIVLGEESGKVKTMQNEHMTFLNEALPSSAVRITGLSGVITPGIEFIVVKSEKEARKIVQDRRSRDIRFKQRTYAAHDTEKMLSDQLTTMSQKTLNIIIKADTASSIEAIISSIKKIKTEKVKVRFISTSVGKINENDIELTKTSSALLIGFHTSISPSAELLIGKDDVNIALHEIIYHLVDEVKLTMKKLLDPLPREDHQGSCEILATFKSSQLGVIVGGKVIEGTLEKDQYARIFRNEEMIWEGKILSLKRVKDDVKKVEKGFECGMVLSNFKSAEPGDIIRTHKIVYEEQEL